ncbi:MAG: hypothetical protein P1V97_07500 [Planctomycetota bacterium]|nr:hypothetical protein [Planctomycetota bacterium]
MKPFAHENPHYQCIKAYYAGKIAARSQRPYIQHIDEGLEIMMRRGACVVAMEAFCLHPMVQGDEDLRQSFGSEDLFGADSRWDWEPRALILAMEYRRVANAYLSGRCIDSISEIQLSVLPEVQEMLVADKVQNRKDFERYHQDHPRHKELTEYFQNWLRRLEISESDYLMLIDGL